MIMWRADAPAARAVLSARSVRMETTPGETPALDLFRLIRQRNNATNLPIDVVGMISMVDQGMTLEEKAQVVRELRKVQRDLNQAILFMRREILSALGDNDEEEPF